MANGGLTAEEFWKLPPDERMKRCGELSEHEAFVMRITDPHLPVSPRCNECKHYDDDGNEFLEFDVENADGFLAGFTEDEVDRIEVVDEGKQDDT